MLSQCLVREHVLTLVTDYVEGESPWFFPRKAAVGYHVPVVSEGELAPKIIWRRVVEVNYIIDKVCCCLVDILQSIFTILFMGTVIDCGSDC